MAHEINSTDNFARAAGTKPAWHKLGIELPEGMRSAVQAGEHTGILWPTYLAPVFAAARAPGDAFGETRPVPCVDVRGRPLAMAQIRGDNGRVLGVVGPTYVTISNRQLAEIADAVVAADPAYRIETCATLQDGLRAFFLVAGPRWEAAAGDEQQSYILVSHGHAGTSALALAPTDIRVVCRNTEVRALAQGTGIRIQHSGDMVSKIRAVKAAMGGIARVMRDARTEAERMVNIGLVDARIRDLFLSIDTELFGDPAQVENPDDRAEAREKQTDRVMAWRRILESPTCALPSIRGTAWACLQAVTEWIDHHRTVRGRKRDDHLAAVLFGDDARLKRAARARVLEYAPTL